MNSVLINPAPHGNGPYIIGLKFALELDRQIGKTSIKIVPHHVNIPDSEFGDLQREILIKNHGFGEDVFLDPVFGSLIKQLTFAGGNYGNRLELIAKHQKTVEDEVGRHFDGRFLAHNLITKKTEEFDGRDFDWEIAHNNVVSTSVLFRYLTTIAPFSKLIRLTDEAVKEGKLRLGYEIRDAADLVRIGTNLEEFSSDIFTSTPSTLTHLNPELLEFEELIPPFVQISHDETAMNKGVYVVRSGIGKKTVTALRAILEVFRKKGYEVYSADPKEGERYANETRISNPGIEYVVGRLGMSTVYLATQHEKPLVTFPFQEWDDPEIWHNEQTFCNQDKPLALRYEGDEGFLERTREVRENLKGLNKGLEERFGTRDGIVYGARKIKGYLNI